MILTRDDLILFASIAVLAPRLRWQCRNPHFEAKWGTRNNTAKAKKITRPVLEKRERGTARTGLRYIHMVTPPARRDQTLWTHKYSPIQWEVVLSRNVSKLTFPPFCAAILFGWPKNNISLSFHPLLSIIFFNLAITSFTRCYGTGTRLGALNSCNRLWTYTERHKF